MTLTTIEARGDAVDRIDCKKLHDALHNLVEQRFKGEFGFYYTHPRAGISRDAVRRALNAQGMFGTDVTTMIAFCMTTFLLIPRRDGTFSLNDPATWHPDPVRRFLQTKKDAGDISREQATPIEQSIHYGWIGSGQISLTSFWNTPRLLLELCQTIERYCDRHGLEWGYLERGVLLCQGGAGGGPHDGEDAAMHLPPRQLIVS